MVLERARLVWTNLAAWRSSSLRFFALIFRGCIACGCLCSTLWSQTCRERLKPSYLRVTRGVLAAIYVGLMGFFAGLGRLCLRCLRNGRVMVTRVGQNRIWTQYMTVYSVIPLPKVPYIYMILANPNGHAKSLAQTSLCLGVPWGRPPLWILTCNSMVGQNHILYGVYMVFLAGKSPKIWSYTVYLYGSGQPYAITRSGKIGTEGGSG